VTDAVAALVLTTADEGCRAAASALFPNARLEVLSVGERRPPVPFQGRLFELLSSVVPGRLVGLVVPVVSGADGGRVRPGCLAGVADHVNLERRGPLTGRWPATIPRDFPSMTGIYQPAFVRPFEGARVYSSGVVAAGVADARRLTRFEARAVREGGWPIVSDSLVPVAIVAAYYGVKLAACGVVQAPLSERE
jgi:hypothetical protein